MRLLLVEDDRLLGSALNKALIFEHYSTEWVQNTEDAKTALTTSLFDVIVLDINLPDGNGIDLLKSLRQTPKISHIPVLLLTADSDIERKVTGLDAGADDYITKPFELKELCARLRVVIRRNLGHADNILRANNIELNLTTKRCTRGAVSFVPSASEFKVLTLLMQHPGVWVSKPQIEEELYGWDGEAESNTVEVNVYNIRKRLGKDSIVTMRGIGYMIHL